MSHSNVQMYALVLGKRRGIHHDAGGERETSRGRTKAMAVLLKIPEVKHLLNLAFGAGVTWWVDPSRYGEG